MAARILSQRVAADQGNPPESLRKPLTMKQRQVAWHRFMIHLRVAENHAESGMTLIDWDAMMERKKGQAQLEHTRHGGKAPAGAKQSHHAKHSTAMSKGAVIVPKALPSNQASWQAWRLAKAACPHLLNQVTPGGNAHQLWYRCSGCGERWIRTEAGDGIPALVGPPPKAQALVPDQGTMIHSVHGPLIYQVGRGWVSPDPPARPIGNPLPGPTIPQEIAVAKHAFHGTSVVESLGPAEVQKQMQALMQLQQQMQMQQQQAAVAQAAAIVNQVAASGLTAATMPGNGENWIMAEQAENESDPLTEEPLPASNPLFQGNNTEGEIRTWTRQAFTTMIGNNVTPHDAAMYLTAQAQQSNQDQWLRDQVVSVVQSELQVIGLAGTPPQ